MKAKEFITQFVEKAQGFIMEVEYIKGLTNDQKKDLLDKRMIKWVELAIDQLPINIFLKLIIKKVVIANIGVLTQKVFDLLKTKIEGFTK